jgi:hypothetical protein
MLNRCVFLVCLGLFLIPGKAGAQGKPSKQQAIANQRMEAFARAMTALGPEGETLDLVRVPEGWGDGRVTARDARALARYCIWGFNQLLEIEGTTVRLGPDAEVRMIDFWIYVWDEVDDETKAVISVADIVWATISRAWDEANPIQRRAMVMQFRGLVEEIWEGIVGETVMYLGGYITPEQYAAVIDQAIAAEYAAAASAGGGESGGFGESLDVIVDYVQAEDSYVINDGSGDIVYPDPPPNGLRPGPSASH